MTNEELFEYLSFEESLDDVEIIRQDEVEQGMLFVLADLKYGVDAMRVAFVVPENEDWLFTPSDWQGAMPESPDEIDTVEWRVNDTDTPGIVFMGLPRLAPWTPTPRDLNRETRKGIGARLKEARKLMAMSVRDVAEMSGVDKNQICRIEAGRANATLDTISSLARAVGLRLVLKEE